MSFINSLTGNQPKIKFYEADTMSANDAKKYALKMGITDSLRGIQQIYGNITNNEELLEKLKEKDSKLKNIFENKTYGDEAKKYYYGAAILGDPVGYVPILGVAKKAKTLSQATTYGAGLGSAYSALAYVGEGESRGFNAVAGATVGGVLGLGGTAIVRGIQKAMKQKPSFASLADRQGDNILQGAARTRAGKNVSNAETDELVELAIKEIQNEKPDNVLGEGIESFYKSIGGDKVWDVAVKNWGTGFAGAAGAVGGYNAFDDPESTETQKIVAGLLIMLGGGAAAKGLGKLSYKDKSLSEIIQSGIVDNYGLPKGYKELKKATFGDVNLLGQQFAKSVREINTLKKEERQTIYKLMTGELDDIPELTNFSNEARNVITKTGQEMVDAGLLSAEVFQRNVNTYIHQSYTKHVMKAGGNPEVYKASRSLKIIGDQLKRRGQKNDKIITKKAYDATLKSKNKNFGKYKDYDVDDITTVVSTKSFNNLSEKLKRKKTFRLEDYKLNKTVTDVRDWEVEKTLGQQTYLKSKTKIQLRRDYTPQEKKDLGLIEDAAFAIAETGRLMTNDLAVYKLYNNIAKNKKYSLDIDEFDAAIDKKTINIDDWIEVPTDKINKLPIPKFGNLSGKFVPREIYDDLVKVQTSKDSGGAVLDNYLAINRVWKKSKTAWNPVVHVNNTVSNVMLYDLAGASYKFMPRGFKELRKGIEGDESATLYNLAKANGVFDSDILSRELTDQTKDTLDKTLKNLADESRPEIINAQKYSLDTFKDLSKKGYEMSFGKLDNLYQLEDQAFRMGLFMDRLSKGMNVADAAADAKKWFIDYDINAPVIDFMRRFPTPFISYTYRAVPLLAESAVRRPWKYAKWAGLAYSLNEVGKGKVPFSEYVSDDPDYGRFKKEIGDEAAERVMMRENMKNKLFGLPFMPSTVIKTPFASGRDKEVPLYIDVRRFIPGGDVFAVGDKGIGIPIPFSDKSINVPEVIAPNFGAPGEVLIPLLTGVDPFTLQKIKGLGLGNDEKVKLQHIISRLTPNIPTTAFTAPLFGTKSKAVKYDPFSGTFGSVKILKALRQIEDGKESRYGTDFTPMEAILSTFGFKLQPVEFSKLVGTKRIEFSKIYSSARQSFYKISKDYREGNISKEDAEEKINNLYKILSRAQIKADSYQKQIEEQRQTKFKGGEVDDVPYTKDEPEDRVNPITGEPYSVTSSVKNPTDIEMDRLGFAEGTKVNSNDEFNLDRYVQHLKDREGTLPYIYLDTRNLPTGGTGHLMLKNELKNYNIKEYKDIKIDENTTRKVAHDNSGNPIVLPSNTTDEWLRNDAQISIEAAQKQAQEYDVSSGRFVEALGSVNFQLGQNWQKKFDKADKALKAKNYDEAIKQVSTGKKEGSVSLWKKQTRNRVEDFVNAINKLKE